MGWFSKEEKKKKYKPTGKIGWFTKTDYPYYYTLIFEKLYEVGSKSKVKLLEVDVRRDCTRTRQECLRNASAGDWVTTSSISWETDEQYMTRTNQPLPPVYEDHEPLGNDDVDYTPHTSNPFTHHFVNNN